MNNSGLDIGRKILSELAEIKRILHDAIKIPRHETVKARDAHGHTKDSQYEPPIAPVSDPKATVAIPTACKTNYKHNKLIEWLTQWKIAMEWGGVAILAAYTGINYCMLRTSTAALEVTHQQLILQERPWIKVTHRIVRPLAFNVRRNGGPMAVMTIDNVLDNVGQSVALNVFTWEALLPVDTTDLTQATTTLRQTCESRRRPKQDAGYTVFPRDPFVDESTIGPSMADIARTERRDVGVAFVLVGCVSYRFPFEPVDALRHQTQFMYFLGALDSDGGMETFVKPQGVADKLVLFKSPFFFTAD